MECIDRVGDLQPKQKQKKKKRRRSSRRRRRRKEEEGEEGRAGEKEEDVEEGQEEAAWEDSCTMQGAEVLCNIIKQLKIIQTTRSLTQLLDQRHLTESVTKRDDALF
jgi:hypothetical protein